MQAWYEGLDVGTAARVQAAVDLLGEHGPGLGRPYKRGEWNRWYRLADDRYDDWLKEMG